MMKIDKKTANWFLVPLTMVYVGCIVPLALSMFLGKSLAGFEEASFWKQVLTVLFAGLPIVGIVGLVGGWIAQLRNKYFTAVCFVILPIAWFLVMVLVSLSSGELITLN